MEAPSSTVNTCLKVLKIVPPAKSSLVLQLIKDGLVPEALNELLQRVVEFPLKSAEDPVVGKSYLLCEFNKQHGGSYRSPYSTDGVSTLSDAFRSFEVQANEVWEAYTQLYYGKEAIGSVYVKEVASATLVACFLVSKHVENDERLAEGRWNSAHMVHVGRVTKGSAKYKISSTVTITMDPSSETTVSAAVSRDTEEVHSVSADLASHLETIGKMIESIEIDIRSNLENVSIPKTSEVASGLRQGNRTGASRPMGIPIMIARPPKGLPPGAASMPGMMMGGAHAAALNAAVLKRAPKK